MAVNLYSYYPTVSLAALNERMSGPGVATGIRSCQIDHVDMMSSELSGMFPNVLDIASTPKSAINSTSFSLPTVILQLQPFNIYHGRRLLQTFGH